MRLYCVVNRCLSLFLIVPILHGCAERSERSPTIKGDRGERQGAQIQEKIFNNGPYAVISDSIGRGMFVRSSFGQIVNKQETTALIKLIPFKEVGKAKFGPNLLTALETNALFSDRRFNAYSGMGGTDEPRFHGIPQLLGLTGPLFESSQAGSTRAELDAHIAKIHAELGALPSSSIKNLIYALGNNDYCGIEEDDPSLVEAHFTEYYLQDIKKMASAFPDADIYVVSPVNIPLVRNITEGGKLRFEGISPLVKLAAMPFLGSPPSCAKIQKIYCPVMFKSNSVELMDALIAALKNAVSQVNAERANSSSDRLVRYADMSKIEFSTKMLAVDCFHPNINGQILLANEAAKLFNGDIIP